MYRLRQVPCCWLSGLDFREAEDALPSHPPDDSVKPQSPTGGTLSPNLLALPTTWSPKAPTALPFTWDFWVSVGAQGHNLFPQ